MAQTGVLAWIKTLALSAVIMAFAWHMSQLHCNPVILIVCGLGALNPIVQARHVRKLAKEGIYDANKEMYWFFKWMAIVLFPFFTVIFIFPGIGLGAITDMAIAILHFALGDKCARIS